MIVLKNPTKLITLICNTIINNIRLNVSMEDYIEQEFLDLSVNYEDEINNPVLPPC